MRILIILLIYLFACAPKETDTITVKGYICKDSPIPFMRRHYKLRIWYEYSYNGVEYEGVKTISKGENRYFKGDSVYVRLSRSNPSHSEVIGKIETHKKEAEYVPQLKHSTGAKAYSVVEKKPAFSYDGATGEKALDEYFFTQIRDAGIKEEGIVGVNFIVDERGMIQNLKVSRSSSSFLDNAAVEIVRNMPQWTPGEYKGERVKVFYLVEIKFNTKEQ